MVRWMKLTTLRCTCHAKSGWLEFCVRAFADMRVYGQSQLKLGESCSHHFPVAEAYFLTTIRSNSVLPNRESEATACPPCEASTRSTERNASGA